MVTIETIIGRVKEYLPSMDENRLRRAYEFAQEAHAKQKRFSGEPYIIHPLHVADILLEFHPDEDSIIAALLHDVAEDTQKGLDDIGRIFGEEVRSLCWGMEKLSKVRSKLNDPQVDNLRKLFLAMAKDFRVVLLKLCDRLHNMRTLKFVNLEKKNRISQETLNIYAPIAARLGIYRLKSQLEDLCFEHLNPTEFNDIKNQLLKTYKSREKHIDMSKKMILEILAKEGVQNLDIDGRVKSIYSIYRKLKKKGRSLIDEIFDVFAMRVVLPDIFKYGKEYTGHVYTALGVMHSHFTPLANRFKDYVAVPKVNGYRSLHTTVMGLGLKEHTQPTEIQIRTATMHQSAELGIAAHWLYEEDSVHSRLKNTGGNGENVCPLFIKNHKDWISGLEKIQQEIKSNQELLDGLKVDIFHDRIFVLTPRGDVKDLPAGATPVDFAYEVHTDIGNHCLGAKVNGNMVPLDYQLKSGEVVEVVTRKNARPSQQWLSFVKTTHARNSIRAWFRNLDDDKNMREGRILLNEKLRQLGMPPIDDNLSVLKNFDGKPISKHERENVLVEIGKGAIQPGAAIRKIFTLEELLVSKSAQLRDKKSKTIKISADKKDKPQLIIGNEKDLPYSFVSCCKADFTDNLIGYVTRGKGVSIHKKTCKTLKGAEKHRLIGVYAVNKNSKYSIIVGVCVDDRVGLIRDLAKVIADNNVNIIDMTQKQLKADRVELNFLVEIEHFDQLDALLSSLEKVPSVRRAFKIN